MNINIENLQKLRDKLRVGQYEFDISDYGLIPSDDPDPMPGHEYVCAPNPYSLNRCPTVACALGYSPYLVQPALKYETWQAYSTRVYGFGYPDTVWDFLFSSCWYEKQPTITDFCERVNLYLEYPIDCDYMASNLDKMFALSIDELKIAIHNLYTQRAEHECCRV